MLMTKEGSAISVLQEAGAIHECKEHGWSKDRADPHAQGSEPSISPVRIRARRLAWRGATRDPQQLDPIGDTCRNADQPMVLSSPADSLRDALAHSSMNSARPALYLAPARLHSDPHITASPPVPQTAHLHRPRPRGFNTMS
jgi:hypothetical protein